MRSTAAVIATGAVLGALVAPVAASAAPPTSAQGAAVRSVLTPQAAALRAAYQKVLDGCEAKRRDGVDIRVWSGSTRVHRELQSPVQRRTRVTSTSLPGNLYTFGFRDPSYSWTHLPVMDTAIGKRALIYLGERDAFVLKGTHAQLNDDDGSGTVEIRPLALCRRLTTSSILPAASEFSDAQWAISSSVQQGASTVFHLEYGATAGENTTLVTVTDGEAVRVENADPWNASTRATNLVYTIDYYRVRIKIPSARRTVSWSRFNRAYRDAHVPTDIVSSLREDMGMRPTVNLTSVAATRSFARTAAHFVRFHTRARVSVVDTSTGAKLVARRDYGPTVVFTLTWKAGVVSYKRTR
ncbi:MAG: hypothetical protein U0S36_03340 [Candidatus Nanopelagicales bacterium]